MADLAGDLYEADLLAWTEAQAALLRRAGSLRLNAVPGLDWENLAGEIEDLGRSRLRELSSRYRAILLHLLKWRYQASLRTPSWRFTIRDQRDEVAEVLAESPSLRGRRQAELDRAYARARKAAADETGLPLATFPERCPFTVEQVEDEGFWPEAGPDA
jgi:hypothetical protein